MGKLFKALEAEHQSFIEKQPLFFVATALEKGRVNVSPKGMDSLRVVSASRVVWMNLTGSGNETATHLQGSNRITLMFCSFEGKPLTLRLYGKATVYHRRDKEWDGLVGSFPVSNGNRQIIDVAIESVQTSCGMSIPFMDFKGPRDELKNWAEKQGEERIEQYWRKKNSVSLDGLPTGIIEKQ